MLLDCQPTVNDEFATGAKDGSQLPARGGERATQEAIEAREVVESGSARQPHEVVMVYRPEVRAQPLTWHLNHPDDPPQKDGSGHWPHRPLYGVYATKDLPLTLVTGMSMTSGHD